MEDRINRAEKARSYRWRPAVEPFRPRRVGPSRPRKPGLGQMLLPGIESAAPPPPAGEAVCPNCGGAEFDDDGDCLRCWEPGVGKKS